MTFSYKEIRLCLAIGLAMLIVKGYCVQASAGRSAQDGRRRTVGGQALRKTQGENRWRLSLTAASVQVLRPSAQRPAASVQVWRSAVRRPAASGQRPGTAIRHHSFLICFAPPPDFSRPTALFRSAHSLWRSYPQGQIDGYPIWLWIRRFRQFESCG